MSKITAALEDAVAKVIANTPDGDERPSARQRGEVDRAFVRIMQLIAPRIRHFIRQYGLAGHWDDAEQCCAIAVHRAIQAYDPTKAQFTTFVNWQIRGELQSLRFRLMTDQRPSAKKVEATTVSLSQMAAGPDGEDNGLEAMLVDEAALEVTESGASDYLARAATECLVEEFVRKGRTAALEQLRRRQPKRALAKARSEGPRLKSAFVGLDPEEIERIEQKFAKDREILLQRVFGEMEAQASDDAEMSRERVRQMGKRASKAMAEIARTDPRFAVMADYRPAEQNRPLAA